MIFIADQITRDIIQPESESKLLQNRHLDTEQLVNRENKLLNYSDNHFIVLNGLFFKQTYQSLVPASKCDDLLLFSAVHRGRQLKASAERAQ